jgi:hypothetical protein
MNDFEYHLKVDKLSTLYRHPFQLEMKKVIKVKKAVITVADKSKALAINSLQEPYMHLSTQRAQPFTPLKPSERSRVHAGTAKRRRRKLHHIETALGRSASSQPSGASRMAPKFQWGWVGFLVTIGFKGQRFIYIRKKHQP